MRIAQLFTFVDVIELIRNETVIKVKIFLHENFTMDHILKFIQPETKIMRCMTDYIQYEIKGMQ